MSALAHSFRRAAREPMAATGFVVLLLLALLAALGPTLIPHDPYAIYLDDRLLPPSGHHPLGTDAFGRDLLARLVVGAQITLGIAALVTLTVLLVGVPLGLVAGYLGGRFDGWLMRAVDMLLALPEFILAIAVAGFLGPSLFNAMLAVALVKWGHYARLTRGIVLAEKHKEYVLAAQVGGCTTLAILRKHLLPQVISPVLTLATLDIGKTILILSSLSYLGLGAQPPLPEWGMMLNDARPYLQTHPFLMIAPGLAILLVVLGSNLLGDGLRDAWEDRTVHSTGGKPHA